MVITASDVPRNSDNSTIRARPTQKRPRIAGVGSGSNLFFPGHEIGNWVLSRRVPHDLKRWRACSSASLAGGGEQLELQN